MAEKPVDPAEELEKNILYDYEKGKYFRFEGGDSAVCDVQGQPIPRFYEGFSGFAKTADRKEIGLFAEVDVLNTEEDVPKYIGRPTKYCGYSTMPRPGMKMGASKEECAYTIPRYLEPIPAKLGKVSVARKKGDDKPKQLSGKQKQKPSFLNTLSAQYVSSLGMNNYINKTYPDMPTKEAVAQTGARNKQIVMNEGLDLMAELRKHRMRTAGKFGTTTRKGVAPFTPLEVHTTEAARDRLINPSNYNQVMTEYFADKAAVEKRRRDRYLQHFIAREEAEAAVGNV